MTKHRKGQGLDPETIVVLVLIGVFSACAAASNFAADSPILTAFCLGLVATALLYRFFGGVEGSTFKVATFKASGSVAVFAFVTWFVNDKLVEQNPIIDPAPSSWIAIDRNGASSAVTIGGELYSQDVSEFLREAVWGVKIESGMIRVTEREHELGKIDFSSLGPLGLFDRIEMIQGRGIRYTGELTAGAEGDLSPIYPYKIRTTQFTDSYNGFSVLDENNAVVLSEGLLRTKNFQFFEHEGRHFLIFVSRAAHNDPVNAPWAVFGFVQVNLILSR